MKKKDKICLTAAIAITVILFGAAIFFAVKKSNETSPNDRIDDIGIIPPIVDDGADVSIITPPVIIERPDKEIEAEADLSIDMGGIINTSQPEVIGVEVEYGSKEGIENEQ